VARRAMAARSPTPRTSAGRRVVHQPPRQQRWRTEVRARHPRQPPALPYDPTPGPAAVTPIAQPRPREREPRGHSCHANSARHGAAPAGAHRGHYEPTPAAQRSLNQGRPRSTAETRDGTPARVFRSRRPRRALRRASRGRPYRRAAMEHRRRAPGSRSGRAAACPPGALGTPSEPTMAHAPGTDVKRAGAPGAHDGGPTPAAPEPHVLGIPTRRARPQHARHELTTWGTAPLPQQGSGAGGGRRGQGAPPACARTHG
jgi:translation initiation factor IF-2